MTALTRGPLPARVYWRRRLLLALLVLGLVVVAVRLLGPGSDASSEAATPGHAGGGRAQPGRRGAVGRRHRHPERDPERQPAAREEKQDRGPVLAEPDGRLLRPRRRGDARRSATPVGGPPGHLRPRAAHDRHARLHLAGLARDARP